MCKKFSKLTALTLSLILAFSIIPAKAETPSVSINLDGAYLDFKDVKPTSRNGRTMVPIRLLAEALGADVGWIQATAQVTLTRANTNIVLTQGSKTAYVNGKPMEMDVAPYTLDGRTMIPVRYISEFFGQTVTWDGASSCVYITEDKSVAGDSNLEAWALPMGSMLAYTHTRLPSEKNNGGPDHFGMCARNSGCVSYCRNLLSNGWNIENREDLISTVFSMTFHGHDGSFREMAADVKLRSQAEREAISAASNAWPSYMWEYTEYVDKKWGDRGILCWDLFRMSNLVQWGYTAGYITYEEALALLEPAAILLQQNFSSWEEAYENYLDGYNWWARNNVLNKDIWQTIRGTYYKNIRREYGQIFDDSLFKTGVLPVPGLSINDVIATLYDGSES